MKKFLIIITLFLIAGAGFAQAPILSIPLPAYTAISHYRLAVAYNSTTVLVFPSAIKPVDRGDRDILAQKQSGVENVLKIKAARRNFSPTNLHVFTENGKVYAFDIFYTDSLATTRDLTRLDQPLNNAYEPNIMLAHEPVNNQQLQNYLELIRRERARFSSIASRYQMSLRLQDINLAGNLLFFRFLIRNHSKLDYTIDFMRIYIRDRQKVKRASLQEVEMKPIYQDTVSLIPGSSAVQYIVAVPKFTIASHKQFLVELYERNGGRALSLPIKNDHLFKAGKL